MSERETRSYEIECEVRAAQRIIAATIPYGREDEINGAFVETLAPGAFARSARERGDKIPVLFGHDAGLPPVGRSKKLADTRAGLAMELSIARTDRGDELLALATEGALPGISPGFSVPAGADEWSDMGRRRVIREAKLIELSLTAFPAYAGALVTAVRDTLDGRSAPQGRSLLLARSDLDLLAQPDHYPEFVPRPIQPRWGY